MVVSPGVLINVEQLLIQHTDQGALIYDPEMVKLFDASEVVEPTEDFLDFAFHLPKEKPDARVYSHYLETDSPPASFEEKEKYLATKFAEFLAPSRVGAYSTMHDKAIYWYGYNHHETQELQIM
jgi:hypothetical protein